MSTPPPLQQFLSEQLAEACSRIVSEYERIYGVTDGHTLFDKKANGEVYNASAKPYASSEGIIKRQASNGARKLTTGSRDLAGVARATSFFEAREEEGGGKEFHSPRKEHPTFAQDEATAPTSPADNGGAQPTSSKPQSPPSLPAEASPGDDNSDVSSTDQVSVTGDREPSDPYATPAAEHFDFFEEKPVSIDVQASKYVIDPELVVYRLWHAIVDVVMVCSTFLTPVKYAFGDLGQPGDVADIFIDLVFVCDILLRFNVAYVVPGGVIWKRSEIARSILHSTGFFIDLFAVIPFGEIASAAGAADSVVNALALLRLLRVYRLMMMFRKLQASAKTNLVFVVMAKFVTFILLWTHIAGCVLYALARENNFESDTWVFRANPELPQLPWYTQYSHMLFWAVGTFKAGPAHGDLAPHTPAEMFWSCLAMMANICLQTYLVSSMAALLTTADVRIYAMRNSLSQLAQFSKRYKLAPQLYHQVKSYTIFKFSMNQELDDNVMGILPEIYRQRVSHALYQDFIEGRALFRGCTPKFLNQLYGSLHAAWHMSGHQLIKEHDASGELQILVEGLVSVSYQGEEVEMLSDGDILTAIPFICHTSQQFSMHTQRLCRILSLSRSAWEVACATNPEDMNQVKSNLAKQCRTRMNQCKPSTQAWKAHAAMTSIVELHLSQEKEEATGALCFASGAGDLDKMRSILRAHPADCSDYDSRSPLHIAASKGQVAAVNLLLGADADVNALDNFGRTPLMEALRSKRMGAADVIAACGGSLGFDFDQMGTVTPAPSSVGFSSSKFDASPRRSDSRLKQRRPSVASQESVKSVKSSRATMSVANSDYFQATASAASELCEAASDPLQLWYLDALIKYGADVNASDYDARTALHVACASGNKGAVKLLLCQKGVNHSPTDNFGRTPLMEAVRHRHENCARILKSHGALHGFATSATGDDANVLHAGQELCQAAFGNDTAYLHGLVTLCGIDVDTPDYDSRTALMLSCAEGYSDAAVSLVQLGANIYKKDRWGHTAVEEARDHGHHGLAEMLESYHTERMKAKPAQTALTA